jgi:pilus assembly protein Flp/PilA
MEKIMEAFWNKAQQFLHDEEGVTAIEYALIAALIAVVIIGAVQLVGTEVSETFNTIANTLSTTN